MKKYLLFFICCHVTNILSWSFSETLNNTTEKVSSWVMGKQARSSSKEYPVSATSPVTLNNYSGTIKISSWNKPILLVEATKKGSEEELNYTKFNVTLNNFDDHPISITTESRSKDKKPAVIDYAIIVPKQAPLTVRTEYGDISLQDHNADVDLQTLNGSIFIEQAGQNIKAKAPHGSVTVEQNELNSNASIFLEAEHEITLVMPKDANATMTANTVQGKVISDTIFITLDPITTKLNKEAYKRMQQHVRGTTGAGGMPVTLETTKGNITIVGN